VELEEAKDASGLLYTCMLDENPQ